HHLHRCHRLAARRQWFLRLCRRQVRPSRAGPEHGPGAGTQGYPCGSPDHRRCHRHRLHPRQFPGTLRAQGTGRNTQPREYRRAVLADSLQAAGRRDARTGSAALDGNLLSLADGAATMSKQVEFYFDVGSPASYLAWTQIRSLAERHGAEVLFQPMLLAGVFKASGNGAPATVPARGAYTRGDVERVVRRYGVPFAQNPFFPINTMQLMRGAVALLDG